MENKQRKKLEINWKLWIGTVFLLFILIASLTSDLWIKRDPYFMEWMRVTLNSDGGIDMAKRPFPISETNILGTDMVGRDLFSRIVIGAKMTFLIVFLLTLGKFALSLPFGMLAGGGNKTIRKLTENWSFVFSGFPPLFAALLVFSMPFFDRLSYWNHIFMMIIVVIFLEWARIALTIKGRTEQVMEEPYIEGAKVLGRKRAGILYNHVLRVIMPDVLVLFVQECARSLMFIGQLAFFGIYFLDVVLVDNDPYPPLRTSLTPEWGALLGESRSFIFSNPLICFIIAGVMVITVIAINLAGEGLKDRLLFPRPKKVGIMGTITMSQRPVWQRATAALAAVVIIISAVLVLPNVKASTAMNYNVETLEPALKALGKREIGSQEAKQAAQLIADQWQEIGLKPVGDGMIEEQAYPEIHDVQEKTYLTINSGENKQELELSHTSFALPNASYGAGEVTAPVALANTRKADSFSQSIAKGDYNGKIIVIPLPERSGYPFIYYLPGIVREAVKADVKGIIFADQTPYSYLSYMDRDEQVVNFEDAPADVLRFMPVFYVDGEEADAVLKAENMTLAYETEKVDVMSTNVVSKIGNIDPEKRNIVFYTYYDEYVPMYYERMPENPDISSSWVDSLTRTAKTIEQNDVPDFNYYFVAMDGLNGKYYGLQQWIEKHPDLVNERTLYVQINHEEAGALFRTAGVDLSAFTFNINSQMDRTVIERSVSVAAWKENMIPYQALVNYHFPRTPNATFFNLNLISNNDNFYPFVIKFLHNLEMEYADLDQQRNESNKTKPTPN